MQQWADLRRREGKTIGCVPTMGFLHEGHLSLIREARKRTDMVVVSIFVNPTQFAPSEDFEAYPRDMDRDTRLCSDALANAIFAPDARALYESGYQTYVNLERLPNHLCGISRPTHFRGVATVVTKLFNIIKPNVAVFGQKDYQQLLIIRQMVKDLNFDIEIIGAPIIREPDGLAMSSRNTYLTANQRKSALSLSLSLEMAQESVKNGITDASKIIAAAREMILSCPETDIDYIAICNPETLDELKIIEGQVLMALAVRVGRTRLIDNRVLNP